MYFSDSTYLPGGGNTKICDIGPLKGSEYYVLINFIDLVVRLDRKIFGSRSWCMDQVQRGPYTMTEWQIFTHPA